MAHHWARAHVAADAAAFAAHARAHVRLSVQLEDQGGESGAGQRLRVGRVWAAMLASVMAIELKAATAWKQGEAEAVLAAVGRVAGVEHAEEHLGAALLVWLAGAGLRWLQAMRAEDAQRGLPGRDDGRLAFQLELGTTLAEMGRSGEAEPLLRECVAARRRQLGEVRLRQASGEVRRARTSAWLDT